MKRESLSGTHTGFFLMQGGEKRGPTLVTTFACPGVVMILAISPRSGSAFARSAARTLRNWLTVLSSREALHECRGRPRLSHTGGSCIQGVRGSLMRF